MNSPRQHSTQAVSLEDLSGIVFDIKRFALHDGPGIRTTVFLKGCPLHCAWCHNPESQDPKPEIMFYADRCTGCGACIRACPQSAIALSDQAVQTSKSRCNGCGQCVDDCPVNARRLVGSSMQAKQIIEQIEADVAFFDESGGGVTLSGGEPLAQPLFAEALLAACRRLRIHTALDTCGDAPWPQLESVALAADLVLYDLKLVDPAKHIRWTGHSSARILDNLHRLDALGKPYWIRIPLIPAVNDGSDSLQALTEKLASLHSVEAIHLLPYHRAGEAKQRQLEWTSRQEFLEPDARTVQELAKKLQDATGVLVHIGG